MALVENITHACVSVWPEMGDVIGLKKAIDGIPVETVTSPR
jgi:hypothetical protein